LQLCWIRGLIVGTRRGVGSDIKVTALSELMTELRGQVCLDAGADMAPLFDAAPDDSPWAHRSCIASYVALITQGRTVRLGGIGRRPPRTL